MASDRTGANRRTRAASRHLSLPQPLLNLSVAASMAGDCPADQRATSSATLTEAVATLVSFKNNAQGHVRLFWVNFAGEEVQFGLIEQGSIHRSNTYPGHVWRVRADSADQHLVDEVRISDGMTEHTIEPCGKKWASAEPNASPPLRRRRGRATNNIISAALNVRRLLPPASVEAAKASRALFPRCEWDNHIAEDYAPPGYYIVCGTEDGERATTTLGFFTSKTREPIVMDVPKDMHHSWHAVRAAITDVLGLSVDRLGDADEDPMAPAPVNELPRWKIFATDGRYRFHSLSFLVQDDVNPTGTSILVEGGVFFWPGVKVGHTTVVKHVAGFEGEPVVLTTLSMRPLIFEVDGIMREDECDHLIAHAKSHMKESVVSKMDHDKGKADTTWRTSKTYFVPKGSTKVLKNLERRVRDLTNIPISHGENAQILQYGESGHYYTHHDYFDPNLYKQSPGTLQLIEHGAKNRLATAFWYMSNVDGGGETNFPRFDGAPPPMDTTTCTQGLSVKPNKGKMIIFFNMLPNGDTDPLSLHAGCSVVGQKLKWSANKWLWNKPFNKHTWAGDETDLLQERGVDLLPKDASVSTGSLDGFARLPDFSSDDPPSDAPISWRGEVNVTHGAVLVAALVLVALLAWRIAGGCSGSGRHVGKKKKGG